MGPPAANVPPPLGAFTSCKSWATYPGTKDARATPMPSVGMRDNPPMPDDITHTWMYGHALTIHVWSLSRARRLVRGLLSSAILCCPIPNQPSSHIPPRNEPLQRTCTPSLTRHERVMVISLTYTHIHIQGRLIHPDTMRLCRCNTDKACVESKTDCKHDSVVPHVKVYECNIAARPTAWCLSGEPK